MDPQDTALKFGQSANWSYAWKSDSNNMQYHGKGYQVFFMKLDNSYSSIGMTKLELGHSILLSLLWIFGIDIAILVKYIYKFKHRVLVHGLLMALVMVGTIIVVSLMIQEKQPGKKSLIPPHRAHYIIGVIVLAWVVLQCIIGLAQRVLLCLSVNPHCIVFIRKVHRYSGILLALLGKTNVIVGWAMKAQTKAQQTPLIIYCLTAALSLLLLGIFIYRSSAKISEDVFNLPPPSKLNQQIQPIPSLQPDVRIMRLMKLPYCHH